MSYCRLIPGTCTVECTAKPTGGTSILVPTAGIIQGMHVEQFNKLYPGYIPVPPYCATGGGGGGTGVPDKGKITEPPKEEPPPACGYPVPVPILPPDADYEARGGNGGNGDAGQEGTKAHWNQPIIGKLVPISVVATMDAEAPEYTVPPNHRFDEQGRLAVPRFGTGDGSFYLIPGELGPQHVAGNKGNSGTNDLALFPDKISETGITILTCEGEDESARGFFGFGKRVPGTNKPGDGWYAQLDPSGTSMKMVMTDSNGDDIEESQIVIYDNAGTWTMVFGTDATKYEMPGTLDPKALWMKLVAAASVQTPPAGQMAYFADEEDGLLKSKDSDSNVATVGGADESAIEAAVEAYLTANPPTVDLSAAWPVGSIFCAVVDTDPATLLGFGTWAAIGAGRVLVGQDTGDGDFDTLEETGGAKTVTLTGAQSGVPAHNHTQAAHSHATTGLLRSSTSGAQTSLITQSQDTSSTQAAFETQQAAPTINNNTPANAAEAHTNVQPYLVVKMWKRTA